jgi:hypothetical protein
MRFIGLILVIAGIGGAYRTYNEWQVGATATAAARPVTLQELAANAANPHVQIRAFDFARKFAYSKRKHDTDFTKVWIPIVAKGSSEIRVVVRTSKVRNLAELEKFCAQTTLQGLIINDIDSLPAEYAAELRKCYPETDFTKCLIVDEGRQPITLVGDLLQHLGIAAGLAFFGLLILGASLSPSPA